MIARLARPALLIAATVALGACSSYGSRGYSGVSLGYSTGGYYPYGISYSRYPSYGWYDGFYYPGTGYYIYDSYGRRHRWSDRHRHYWEARRGDRRDHRDNWSGYRRDRDGRYHDGDRLRGDDRDWRGRDGNRGEARGSRRDGDGSASGERRSGRSERPSRSVDRGREFRRGSRD